MNARRFLAAAFLAVATLAVPGQASAMTVRRSEGQATQQRSEFVANAINKIVADTARVNPILSNAIHDYFYKTPQGQPAAPGVTAFEGELLAVQNLADKGKLDLDRVQIEGILLDIVKTDVMPQLMAANNTQPSPSSQQ